MSQRLRILGVLLLVAQAPHMAFGQTSDPLAVYRTSNVPSWALQVLGRDFLVTNDWYDRVNPFYQRADFDGDGQADIALLIRQRNTGKVGIAFVHRANSTVHMVGAGRALGNGGDDFSWLGVWSVHDRATREVPAARGEILLVEKPESAGGLIYWDGSAYRWLQHGD
jgi:hypothetical protein